MSDIKVLKFGTSSMGKIGSNVMGFIPPPVPLTISSCILFLDNDPTSMTLSGSNKVSQWSDKSGNNNHFTQGTGANQPTFVANGINGQNGVKWNNGFNEFLDCTFGTTYNQIYDIIAVWNIDASSTQLYPFVYDSAGVGTRVQLFWWTDNVRAGTTSAQIAYAKTRPFNLIANHVSFNGASTTVYENNVLKSTINGGTGALTSLRLGHANTIDTLSRLSGYICEVLIYSRQLTSGERSTLQTYLATKYGL